MIRNATWSWAQWDACFTIEQLLRLGQCQSNCRLFLSVYDEEANRTFSEAIRELKQVINISHWEKYLARNTHSNMETLTGTGG